MTGKEWNEYFISLTPERREEIRKALITLANDDVFREAFGPSHCELLAILQFPLTPHSAVDKRR